MAQPETFPGPSLFAVLAVVSFLWIAGGLVLLSLVGVEWRAIAAALRTMDTRKPEDVEATAASATGE